MSNLNKKYNKYPEDCKQDIRDMLAEELYPTAVSRYLGVPLWLVKYIKNTTYYNQKNRAYYHSHRDTQLARMRVYRTKHKHE